MRTQEEILARIEAVKDRNGFLPFEKSDLTYALSFENAKQFLIEEVEREAWEQSADFGKDSQYWRDEIVKYLPFAYEKARDQRGLSAIRSIQHFLAWTWLAGDDDMTRMIETAEDEVDADGNGDYGLSVLNKLADYYGYKDV